MTSFVDENSLREHRRTLGLRSNPSAEDINAAFRRLSKDAHPDAGGSLDRFTELQLARAELLQAHDHIVEPTVYLGTEGRRPGDGPDEAGRMRRAPAWLPGALVTLVLGIVSVVVGIASADRNVLVIGAIVALAAGSFVTGSLRAHRFARNRRPRQR